MFLAPFPLPAFLQQSSVWLPAAGTFLAALATLLLAKLLLTKHFRRWAEKTKNEFDDFVVELLASLPKTFLFLAAALFAWNFAPLSPENLAGRLLFAAFLLMAIAQAARVSREILSFSFRKIWRGETSSRQATVTHALEMLVGIFLWAAGLLLLLGNLGFDISALVASLGIGGVAVAFALQKILGDLFSSFAIFFDRPFEIGDYIVVGVDSGVVKKIGLKSTRLQTLQGEELVVANAELSGARVQNFKKLRRRRLVFSFGVEYSTPVEKVAKIPALIREIIDKQEGATPDRVHFRKFGDSALEFEAVFFFDGGEFAAALDIQQAVNLEILRRFEKEGIAMAFPTQTVFVRKEG